MNICLVSQEYPPDTALGGIGTQTWNKARTLAILGHTVHVLSCGHSKSETVSTETDRGITVHRMPPPGEWGEERFSLYDPAAYWLGYSWSVLRELERLTRSTRFDLINFPEYGAEGFAFQLNRSRWNWVPIVVQLHGPVTMFAERIGWPEADSSLGRVGGFMEGTSITLADSLMASSANIADFAAAKYGVARDSIDVVHCGVDCTIFSPPPEDSGRGRHPTVLFVGNITPSKGLGVVFEAVLRLRAKYPDVRLHILGKDAEGEFARTLRKRAQLEGAEANLVFGGFVGERDRLPEFYREADVFCSPAHHEVGVANVYVEAMACGCPVVASTTGGAPEAVIHEQTGLLVPPSDVLATTAALDRILGDVALRRRLGSSGRQRAEAYFAIDKYIARVLAAYEKTINRSRQKLSALKDKDPDE